MKHSRLILSISGLALVLAAVPVALGLMETWTTFKGPLLRFSYPKSWERPTPCIDGKNGGFAILEDTGVVARKLKTSKLHVTVYPREKRFDLKSVVASILDKNQDVPVHPFRFENGQEGVSFDLPVFDPLDRIVGGRRIVGTYVLMRFYLFEGKDGRVCEASYDVPASFIARTRADRLYGRIIRSLDLVAITTDAPRG